MPAWQRHITLFALVSFASSVCSTDILEGRNSAYEQLSQEEQMTMALSHWEMVKEAARENFDQKVLDEASRFEGAVPPLEGDAEFGTRRDLDQEKKDSPLAKAICMCMASELAYQITESIPYKPNACKRGKDCYMWDAGHSVTPLWYKSKPGATNHPQWYWTPHKKATQKAQSDFEDWMPTSTLKVSGWGFTALAQSAGLTDVAAENKFLINLLEDYRLKPRRAPHPESELTRTPKEDLKLCFDRQGQGPTSDEKACLVRKSGCMKNIIARNFQFLEVKTNAIAKRLKKDNKVDKDVILDGVTVALDLLGLLEPWGLAFDLLNAAIAGIRKKWLDMSLSLAGAIPGLGGYFVSLKRLKSLNKPGVTEALKSFIDAAAKLKDDLIKHGQQGFTRAKKWFKDTAMHVKSVGRLFVAGMKTKKLWFDKVKTSVTSFLSNKAANPSTRKANLKKSLVDVRLTIDRMLLPAMKKLCGANWAIQMVAATGGLMHYTEFPGGIRETGEWMIAAATCLDAYCGAQNSPADAKQYMMLYAECTLTMAGESFKKAMAASGAKEDELEAIGATNDPTIFPKKKPKEISEEEKAKREKAFEKVAEKDVGVDDFCGQGVPEDSAKAQQSVASSDGGTDAISLGRTAASNKGHPDSNEAVKARHGNRNHIERGGGSALQPTDARANTRAVQGLEGGVCDAGKIWKGVKVDEKGTCEGPSGCPDGVSVSNMCRKAPANVKCCLRYGCRSGPGRCLRRTECDAKTHTWKRGLCKGPRGVRCCAPK